jgi:hypothetical protein
MERTDGALLGTTLVLNTLEHTFTPIAVIGKAARFTRSPPQGGSCGDHCRCLSTVWISDQLESPTTRLVSTVCGHKIRLV